MRVGQRGGVRGAGRLGRLLAAVGLGLLLVLAGSVLPGGGGNTVRAANCTVTNANDTGAGSLRAALANTNGFSNCTAITITAIGTLNLGSDLPTVLTTVSVSGPGAANFTINGASNAHSAFAVSSPGALTLSGVTVSAAFFGIDLLANTTATVSNTTFVGNTIAVYANGSGSVATVSTSLFNGGTSAVQLNSGGTVNVTSSTFDNTPTGLGFNLGGTATVTNSTFSANNIAGLNFSGVGGNATVKNSTFSGNNNGLNFLNGGSATLINDLFAKGNSFNCSVVGGTITNNGHNLADDTTCFANNSGTGSSSHTVGAGLTGLVAGGLKDNGGPTQTISLAANSPAVNAGDDTTCQATGGTNPVNRVDQRGAVRPQGTCDIGAVELAASPCVLTSLADSGTGTLRACLGFPEVTAITSAVTGTITLASSMPHIARTVSVTGPGPTAASLTIDGNGQLFDPFDVFSGGNLTLSTLKVANANFAVSLFANATATVTNVTFDNNVVGLDLGTGLAATVTGSTFRNNQAGLRLVSGKTATVTNSTFSGNSNGLFFFTGGTATVTNSTFGGNSNGLFFGASGGTAVLANTLLAKGAGANCAFTTGGVITDNGHNLADDATCVAGQIVAAGTTGLDPNGLQSNGGPTQTIALALSSPAVDAGDAAACTNAPVNGTDQRGVARPQVGCDIGAFELSYAGLTVTTVGSGSGTVGRSPVGTGAGPFRYTPGTVVTLTPQPATGSIFTGWTVGGVYRGWAGPITLTLDTSYAVQATFALAPSFTDIGVAGAQFDAIANLAARDTIKGLNAQQYGPAQGVQRAQMAALIARAMPNGPGAAPTFLAPPNCVSVGSWDCEDWGTNPFVDQNGLIDSLWRDVGTLAHYGVARGVDATHFGPTKPVTYAETLTFITRAMVTKGYWVAQPNAPLPAGVPAVFATDARTFAFYTQPVGGIPSPPANWNDGATRGWFAQALWQALNSYWGTEGNLPDGSPAGGNVP